MKIIKGTEPIFVAHPVFLIFAQPGLFKTSLSYSAANPLLIDADQGAHRAVNRRDTVQVETWADIAEVTQSKDALKLYDTVIADTVGRVLDLMTADIIEETPKYNRDGALTQQGWGVLKTKFRQWVTQLRAMGKDVVLIAHAKEEKDGDTTVIRPDIQGGSYGEVMKISDFVGFGYMRGKDRVLDFNPTDRWVGKNPAGWKPFTVPPIAKATTFMAERIDEGRDALGRLSDESAAALRVVEDWRTKIANLTTADEMNAVIPEIKALAPMLALQVTPLLMDHAKALAITFDKAKKLFVQPEPETVAS